jgi:predicted O-linked N-acetylglucosamine transferase (SPINDLY family)
MSIDAAPTGGDGRRIGPAAAAQPPAESTFQQGLRLASRGNWQAAARAFEAVAAARPDDPLAWLNLADARVKQGDFERGAQAACRAVALDPRCERGLDIAARCFEHAARHGDLVALFQSADMAQVAAADLHLRLGIAFTRLGRFEEAVKALLDALRRDMRSTAAYAQLGNVFQLLKMPQEARESFRNALVLGRSPVEMVSAVIFTSLEACSWNDLAADLAALEGHVARGAGQPTPFYVLNFSWTRTRQLEAARAHARRLAGGITALPPPARRRPAGPIRVGFLSSDFHEHATAYLIAELFERHDRRRLQFHAYSYGEDDQSPMRRRIEAAFGKNFVEARNLASAALARRIRDDAIDVLIDLKGYTLFSRNDVFAYRAAPIQVNYLGFPGSLGSDHVDYIIGDPVVSPIDHADGFAEKIAQLPNCYQPNDRQRPVAQAGSRADWGLPDKAFVFCCFNANYKITPVVFDRWCSLLRQIDDAVLWLFVANPQARHNLVAEAQARGVAPERLVWATPLPLAEHLGRMRNADLFLDTLPVNAHTTASDALWSGLPVLTVAGDSFVSRVAASLLRAAGLPELVADDLDGYEQMALALAHDRGRLATLRERLANQRGTCALFDSERYAADFADLMQRMMELHGQGQAPRHLPAGDGTAGG